MNENPGALQQIQASLQHIDLVPFFAQVNLYFGDSLSTAGGNPRRPDADRQEQWRQAFNDEAERMASLIAITLTAVSALPPPNNDKTDKTRFYFRSMKQQQTELLIQISDEIEIIRAAIRQSIQVQAVLADQALPLKAAATFLTIMRERIRNRPSFVMRGASDDEKIQSLNQMFANLREYETHLGEAFAPGLADGSPDPWGGVLNQPFLEVGLDIRRRAERLNALTAELKAGFRLLKRLAVSGYGWRLKGQLNKMVERHNLRILEFRQTIDALRRHALAPYPPPQTGF